MVTKIGRVQSRRTNTASKIFTSAELLEGELGLNMVDRKLYSKDASNNVFQIGGEPGRDVGNLLHYENFGDVPTLLTDEYIMIRAASPHPDDYATVAIYRNTGPSLGAGTLGNVNANLIVRTDVESNTDAFQWNGLFQLQVHPGLTRTETSGRNEPLALGATLRKQSDIPAWCLYSSTEDFTENPVYATLGWELGFKANGPDPNDRRVVIDAQMNSIDDTPGYPKYGDNEIACFLAIGPSLGESERVILKRAIVIKGRVGTSIDLTETTAHSREAVALPPGGYLSWKASPTASLNAKLGWSEGIGWQMHGLAVSPSASGGTATLPSNPDSFISIEVSPGVIRKIPAYRT